MAITPEEWAAFRKKVGEQMTKIQEGVDDFSVALDANTPDVLEWVAAEAGTLALECRKLQEKV